MDIDGLLQSFKSKKVLVVGDLMLDILIDHEVSKTSAEFDGPVYRELRRDYYPGGAANVAMNCRSLGADVSLIGPIGHDPEGVILFSRLRSAGVNVISHKWSAIEEGWYDTTSKVRFSVDGKIIHRVDRDILYGIRTDKVLSCLNTKFDVLLLSDYDKGALHNENFCREVIHRFRKYNPGAIVCVAPKTKLYDKLPKVDLISVNDHEYLSIVGQTNCTDNSSVLGAKYVLRTLGKAGARIYENGYNSTRVFCREEKNPDVCGCGDSAFAAASLALTTTKTYWVISRMAVAAGAAKVNSRGTYSVTTEDISKYYGCTEMEYL